MLSFNKNEGIIDFKLSDAAVWNLQVVNESAEFILVGRKDLLPVTLRADDLLTIRMGRVDAFVDLDDMGEWANARSTSV